MPPKNSKQAKRGVKFEEVKQHMEQERESESEFDGDESSITSPEESIKESN